MKNISKKKKKNNNNNKTHLFQGSLKRGFFGGKTLMYEPYKLALNFVISVVNRENV